MKKVGKYYLEKNTKSGWNRHGILTTIKRYLINNSVAKSRLTTKNLNFCQTSTKHRGTAFSPTAITANTEILYFHFQVF